LTQLLYLLSQNSFTPEILITSYIHSKPIQKTVERRGGGGGCGRNILEQQRLVFDIKNSLV